MAPRELLVDTETMRDDIKEWGGKARTQTGGTVALPGRHSWESLCCARIYIVKFSIYLQFRLRVHKTEKRGDSGYPRAEWSCAGGPVASTYRAGRRGVGRRCRGLKWVDSGVPGPTCTVHLTLRALKSHLRSKHISLSRRCCRTSWGQLVHVHEGGTPLLSSQAPDSCKVSRRDTPFLSIQ